MIFDKIVSHTPYRFFRKMKKNKKVNKTRVMVGRGLQTSLIHIQHISALIPP
jgi:hypothetical protein